MNELRDMLMSKFDYYNAIYHQSSTEGYWSNFSQKDQETLFLSLETKSTKEAIEENFSQYYNMIFDQTRAVGLQLLEIQKNEIGIDYGCMWGNLMLVAARQCKAMLGVDQTIDSLKFLKKRIEEEKINNCYLLNANLRNGLNIEGVFDFSIVNGVLEWIPQQEAVDLKDHFKKKRIKFVTPETNPRLEQLAFLKNVNKTLKSNGRLYLAIENRYDYKHFLWKRDPHSNLYFTTILPRFFANIISNIWYGRPYVNYIYSIKELKKLLSEAGFDRYKFSVAFPDYHFPLKIIPAEKKYFDHFKTVFYWKKRTDLWAKIVFKIIKIMDFIIFKKLKIFSLAPAFIIIAYKKNSNS
ncbi:MAG: class I SAM-dependent methyltransferase [Bacteroidetes bacterium]|nr:class I SAM-dependent methyltransferase [Bacteroidota bacterium]